MGSDFSRKWHLESSRVAWIVALVLASVLVVQFFDIPSKGRVLSLFPLGSSHFNSSGPYGGVRYGQQSNLMNHSLPTRQESGEGAVLKENAVLGDMPDIKHTDEEDSMVRTASFVPEQTGTSSEISPPAPADVSSSVSITASVAPAPYEAIDENSSSVLVSGADAGIAPSPTASDVSSSTESATSESASPRESDVGVETGASGNESNGASNSPVALAAQPSSVNSPPPPAEQTKISENPSVASISDMNGMLLRSRASSFSETPLWSSAADQELLDARLQIEQAPIISHHPALYAPIYRNLTTFVKSYEIMEQKLKVYVYKDGERPVFHNPRLRGIYASEGWFMKHMEASSQFVTSNPDEAHLFYLPFSSQLLVDYVYVKDSHSFDDINAFLKNYVDTIKSRHPFWNRTDGADHFLAGCHDWATYETKHHMSSCIRALCNSDIKEGFQFGKDVALPETNVQSPQNPMRVTGGSPASKRTTLAFFAGKMHGDVRSILVKHWENRDPEMQISGPIRKGYMQYMQNSKYCVCAKGYEVNSPRVVEAILYGCVPVIISDNFVPPFFDVLNWEAFAVFVLERDIPNLKNILVSISETRYAVMQHRVRRVRQHFIWHNVPKRYDIFHMILHSVWYNRVFRVRPE
ncbi:putative glycosyltransferase [Salvia divinorum]|uniref:Glycosyltransferase n=1 Tax=Salvia divinorum TaxID=28513 RepID=A0ABD1HLN3_SALDI